MWGLWRKELRSTLPFLVLAAIIPLLGIVYELIAGLPNMKPFGATYQDYVVSPNEGSVLISLFILALASGLLVREYDEGTMEFLDSLPVSRSRVFAVKIAAAVLVLLVLTVLDAATTLLFHAFSRTSLDTSFHLGFWFTAVGMRMCQAMVILSLGLACSFLRRFGWLLIGLLFWAYILVHEFMPSIAVLDVLALSQPQIEGQEWIVPQRLLAVQAALGGVLMFTAYVLFLGWGDAMMRGFQRLTRSRVGSGFLLVGSLLVGVVAVSLSYYVMSNDPKITEGGDPGAVTVEYPSWSTSRARSRCYEFAYPTNLAGRVLPLVAAADQVYDKVRQFFAAEAGEPIVVDATSLLPRHAGLAYWDKIRLNLAVSEELPELESILGHETAHVFLERLSDTRLTEQFNSTRFFHEGVASYVEYELFDSGRDVAGLRRIAAVMRDRNEVDMEELVDNSLLAARQDGNLVYPLGELFVAELVARHGEAAVGKIARAMAREGAPENLSGPELWRDLFQACGYDFEGLVDAYYARLDAEVERCRDFVDGVPRIRGALESDDELVTVSIHWEAADDWQPVCRFRQEEEAAERFYMDGLETEEGTFVAWRDDFPSSTVWYQVGLRHADDTVIFEPWVSVKLKE
ncbi:MAG: ABC transporter permease [Planctomycetaceae bacterium]|nr:ABC transporter permease [Planctomycetaceae bacterium]